MKENKNLVKDFLLENKIIDPNNFIYSFFYEDIEWFAYNISDNTAKYVSYELTSHGLGYAFCVIIKCTHFSYDIKSLFYSKSFSNDTTGEWEDISDELKNKLLSNAMDDLQLWK